MTSAALSAAAQAGGIPKGWTPDDLADLAARHHLLACRAQDYARRLWHLRERFMLRDLLLTMGRA